MTDDQKWAIVADTLAKLMKHHDTHLAALNAVKLDCDSPLVAPMWAVQNLLIETLEHFVGDVWGNIDWFVSECDFGRDPKEAGVGDKERVIKTIEDLRWLVELKVD